MNKYFVILFLTVFLFSCRKEKEDEISPAIKEATGTVWLSGGLYFCATQVRLDSGDTLIPVNTEKILAFEVDDRVLIEYEELEKGETRCKIGKDCLVINVSPLD
jgi:hypothetical protein